jgi:hypothetical protein
MDNNAKDSKMRRIVVSALVVVLLFVLPAVSWLYLHQGLDYRKKSISELKDLGKAGNFELKNQKNLPVSQGLLRGKVTVAQFLPADLAEGKAKVERLAGIHENFDDTEDVLFLSFVPKDTTFSLLELARQLNIRDDNQWFLMYADSAQMAELSSLVYRPADPMNELILVDTSLTIRKYYDIRQNAAMGRLVEHISIVIPEQKRR